MGDRWDDALRHQRAACVGFARLIAQGRIAVAEAEAALAAAGAAAAPAMDAGGRRTRLAWWLRGALAAEVVRAGMDARELLAGGPGAEVSPDCVAWAAAQDRAQDRRLRRAGYAALDRAGDEMAVRAAIADAAAGMDPVPGLDALRAALAVVLRGARWQRARA